MGLINSPENGATEIPGTSNDSLFVFLAGPIRNWWKPGMEGTLIHQTYMNQREKLHRVLSEEFLVYAPHKAWRGPWDERAQHINDAAVRACDAFVWLNIPGLLAHGTDEELWLALQFNKPSYRINCGVTVSQELFDEQLLSLQLDLSVLACEKN